MKRTRGYADPKMAAAGDRSFDDFEGDTITFTLAGGLTSPLTTPRRYVEVERSHQPAVEPVIDSLPMAREVRVVEKQPYDVGMKRFQEIMERFPLHWVPGMSRFITEDREIIAEFGYNTVNTNICMGMGYANGHQLHGGKISLPLIVKNNLEENAIVLEKLHPMVYRMSMDRKNLVNIEEEPFSGVLLEVGFYSRVIGSDKKDYLGKIKAFFPKTDDKMMFYLDLSKIK